MTISEVIAMLERLKADHGDLPVIVYDTEHGVDLPDISVEFNTDGPEPVVTIVGGYAE